MARNYNTVAGSSGSGVQLTNVVLDVWAKEILLAAEPILKFESIAVKKTDLAVTPGQTMKFLKYSALTGYPTIGENTEISTDTMATSTVSITVSEQVKALELTELLLRTSSDDLMKTASTLLGQHYAKYRDALIRDALIGGANVLYSQKGGSATSRAGLTGSSTFNVDLIRDAVEFLATNKAPKFAMDAYVCFVHPHQARHLRADSAWINVSAYAAPGQMLTGEIGRIEDVRFIETTQVPYVKISTQDIWADGADTGNNTGVAANTATNVYLSPIVGDYAVGIADALPVEMRDDGVIDLGRRHTLGYYWIGGAGLIETGHSCILETA